MKELITYPLNDVDYSAEDAGLFHCTRKSGVWYEDSFPIEVSGADNTIFIGKGLAWFSNTEFWGKVAAQKTKVSLDLEYADPVYDRIDIIALQFDANKNATNLIVKKGEAKTNPTIPAISRTEAVYELYLYAITRPAASLTVTSENVRDLRLDDAYCGLMADSVTSLDFPIVPVEKGGTGVTTVNGIKNLLGLAKAAFVDLVSVALGGTGKSTHTANSVLTGNGTNAINNVPTANGAFFATGTNAAPKFATLPIAQGGTSATTAAGARNNLGLGNTTGALPIANGGTGATTASGARNALGLGNTTGALPVANGGTGANSASSARSNLGLGSVATESLLPIAKGGTGATDAPTARANLGLNDKLFIQYPLNGCNIDSTGENWTVDISEEGHGTIPDTWINVTQHSSGHFISQIAIKCNKDPNTSRAAGAIWIRDKYSGSGWSKWDRLAKHDQMMAYLNDLSDRIDSLRG